MTQEEFNPSYVSSRNDILALIPRSAKMILDVGCSTGQLGLEVKRRNLATVTGIELDSKMATVAKENLDKVIVGNVETLTIADHLSKHDFDCIIFGDILEHLRDPWSILKEFRDYLTDKGVIVASIPNVRHYSTIINLLRGDWPYRKRGIHDKTHLRFFTLNQIDRMFSSARLRIETVKRKYRIIERPHRLNKWSRYCAFWPVKDFVTFQYLIVAVRAEPGM